VDEMNEAQRAWKQWYKLFKKSINRGDIDTADTRRSRMHDQTYAAALERIIARQAREIEALTAEIERMQTVIDDLDGFSCSFAAVMLTNKNVGIRHTEYEGEREA